MVEERRFAEEMRRTRGAGRGWRRAGLVGALLSSVMPTVSAHANERRVVVGQDRRTPIERAIELGGGLDRRYAATGVVECGGVRGIGQLTGTDDVVTSAAHVFFDESGRPRSERGACVFVAAGPHGEERVPLVLDPKLCGSTAPYGASGRHDWAAARLVRPIVGLHAYPIAPEPRPGDRVAVVAVEDGRKTVEICRVRALVEADGGAREIRTDCTGFDGMSGAAYLTPSGRPRVVGVHVGFRSVDPSTAAPYSTSHYTFGSTIGRSLRGAFADAR